MTLGNIIFFSKVKKIISEMLIIKFDRQKSYRIFGRLKLLLHISHIYYEKNISAIKEKKKK